MPRGPDGASGSRESPRWVLSLALWAGLVTGFCEVAVFGIELLRPGYVERSRDAVWMVPAFYSALFLMAVGVPLAAAARVVRIPWRTAAGFFAAVGAFLVLLLFPRLHTAGSLVLAAGVGASVARLSLERVTTVRRLISLTLPWLVGSVGVLAVMTLGWRAFAERRLVRTRPAAERGAPNVLLLILDTVRAADMSLYGYARRTTPELEQFAGGGVVFERAFSPASWTTPSHASMFTGYWAIDLDANWKQPLGKRWPTLAEVLRARGYATAAFVANQVYTGWESGLARGFERFDDYPVSVWSAMAGTAFGDAVYPAVRSIAAPLFQRMPLVWRVRLPHPSQHRSAEQINDAFLSWLDRARPATFFAFLNFMDAHMPFAPPDSFRNRFRLREAGPQSAEAWSAAPERPLTPADVAPKQAAYDGSITYLDSELGRLFRELKRRGLLDNTLVIVASDHGEEFAEHGLVDHGNSLYRPSVQVPLVIWFPRHVPEGRRVAAPVSLRNLAATVLELVDAGRSALPGRSLARFWRGDDVTPDTIVTSVRQVQNQPAWYPASQGDLNSIAFDGWRYIRNEGTGAEELYDFETDLLEHRNVVGSPDGDALLPRYRAAIAALRPGAPGGRLAGP